MSKQPLLILAICFILGIFCEDVSLLNKTVIFIIAGGCLLVLISFFFHSYLLHKTRHILLGLLFFGAGIILHSFNTFTAGSFPVPSNVNITFKIFKKLNSSEKNKKYEAFVHVGKESFNAVLYLTKKEKDLDFRHYYQADAYLSKPKPPQYDFQFNYAGYLKRKNIEYQCYLSKEISSAQRDDLTFNELIQQYRFEILQQIDQAGISPKTREFLKGIILADRTETDAGTAEDFNRSGMVHLLAISGTHIVVIFGIFYLMLTQFSPLRFRKYAVVSSLAFIWLFAAGIGFGNSVMRSCIMITIYFVYVLLQRKPDLLHSLSLSALIILVADTQQVFDIGFQLSFLAVLGIFWLNQPVLKYLPRQDGYFKKLFFNAVSISISAQLATLPLVLFYFHQFSLVSVPANILIVPFSELIIVFSFLMVILIALRIDFGLINSVYDGIVQILLKLIHWFAEAERLFFANIPMNIVEVLFLFIIVYQMRFLLLKINFKNSMKWTFAVIAFCMVRTVFSINENRKDEILLHDFNKAKILSVKKGSRVCFWVTENTDKTKLVRFIAGPYCSSRRTRIIEIKTFPGEAGKVFCDGKIYDLK
ncbi:ComEC/Rec2 family competence protein [Chryseobacterium kwangjuense]|uniref:ComEC/Rec2 family competence protein n=1 Tax=Chryseobacterium kwangjuense TaxID=267125 RepID=A0ABW9K0P9_9FLAO